MRNPFDNTTLDTRNELISNMAAENKRWEDMITSTNLTGNSRHTWQTIRKISSEPRAPNPLCLVTANQFAYQLLVNGRGEMPIKPNCLKLFPISEDDASLVLCCCLPTSMTLASGGSPIFPLVVHQPASSSIWPAVQSLQRGLSTNPGVTMWCVCGCS